MNLATQCPHCGTAFKVVRDQLKVSQGWVRCGQCNEVFDSSPQLRELPSDAKTSAAWLATVDTAPSQSASRPLPAIAATVQHAGSPAAPSALPPSSTTALAPAIQLITTTEATPTPPSCSDFSFMADAQAQSTLAASPRGRAAKWVGGVALVALACALLGQIVHHERDHLAATDLRVHDVLKQACEALRCVIQPYRHIESITVESSSFSKLKGDAYLLSFVVTNSSDIPLAKPAIELTLTDSRDLPVLRRVLRPQDWDTSAMSLSPRGEWTGRLGLTMTGVTTEMERSISGYRLLAFYP